MLEILGRSHRMCDGVSRRGFMKIGALGIGGLTLADLLRAEAAAGVQSSSKSVINIHLGGGPSHQDTFDPKPHAPKEYRGEFSPIRTNVEGFDVCELYPQLATMADKFAVVRSLVGSNAGHSNFQTHTGYNQKSLESIGGRPSLGSVISKLHGPAANGAPPFISYNKGTAGYLGATHAPYEPGRSGGNLTLNKSLTEDRLRNRASLLGSLDRIKRNVDASGKMVALDSFTNRAIDMVTSGEIADALDVKQEDPKTLERYGKKNESLLRARRLVEAGVRCITMNGSWGNWDTHNDNFKRLRTMLPEMDQGISALIEDLHVRGLADDTVVVVWGEFGRTPRINTRAGRDHWPRVGMAFLAGGGLRTGQFVGETSRDAGEATNRPVDYQEVFATLYHCLGIDLETTQFVDPAGRPQYLLEKRTPIRELV